MRKRLMLFCFLWAALGGQSLSDLMAARMGI